MNIFRVDNDPRQAAADLCDRHVVKMICESVQMLSTALNVYGQTPEWAYKPTHVNHPCSKWCRETSANYMWLVEHARGIGHQYTLRYNKIHKCSEHLDDYAAAVKFIPCGAETPFALAMPDQFKNMTGDIVFKYRAYIAGSKFRFAKWKYSPEPHWWNDMRAYVIKNNLEVINEKDDGVK
jgi:hypothetical protein